MLALKKEGNKEMSLTTGSFKMKKKTTGMKFVRRKSLKENQEPKIMEEDFDSG